MSFPQSLLSIGLSPGFTHQQFCCAMEFERSDEIRALAHREWLAIQGPVYNEWETPIKIIWENEENISYENA